MLALEALKASFAVHVVVALADARLEAAWDRGAVQVRTLELRRISDVVRVIAVVPIVASSDPGATGDRFAVRALEALKLSLAVAVVVALAGARLEATPDRAAVQVRTSEFSVEP